jgi:outer membrane receptor protein involved in Fe transport
MKKTVLQNYIVKLIVLSGIFCIPFIFLLSPSEALAQTHSISGTVTETQTGDALPGVNILVVGTSTGAATNGQGHYSLNVPSLKDTLRFSFIGYKTQIVPINGRTTININLAPTIFSGKQLVVVGYGKQRRENMTTAVTQISGKEMQDRSLSNPIEGLQGVSPGLNFSVSANGGRPGNSKSINIRGLGSLSGGKPLVLVDGVPQDLNTVNPDAIKNISILKGPVASAIYGSRAPLE